MESLEIEICKPIFWEPRIQKEYQEVIREYYMNILSKQSKGAILMSYCRGRISEGLDFKYNAARLVIIVGVPNLSMRAPNVLLKQ
jgi:regulator of telomere elongation helicase 1